MSYHFALSETPVIVEEGAPSICPDCSYLKEGSCVWCPDDGQMPGCEGCVNHKRARESWYRRSEVLIPMALAVATTVVATIITNLTMRRLRIKGAA